MNLLNYVPGDSFLHRLNPVTKLVAAFMYGIASILCNNVFAEIGFIILMLLISATAGLFKRALLLTRNLISLMWEFETDRICWRPISFRIPAV